MHTRDPVISIYYPLPTHTTTKERQPLTLQQSHTRSLHKQAAAVAVAVCIDWNFGLHKDSCFFKREIYSVYRVDVLLFFIILLYTTPHPMYNLSCESPASSHEQKACFDKKEIGIGRSPQSRPSILPQKSRPHLSHICSFMHISYILCIHSSFASLSLTFQQLKVRPATVL